MKHSELLYHRQFQSTRFTFWAGIYTRAYRLKKTTTGQHLKPECIEAPFLSSRKQWCSVNVHFQGIDLVFALPQELDYFLGVMTQNPLPSGHRLLPGTRKGRPNRHWLSRLPKKAKPYKFRQALCSYLEKNAHVKDFRAYYAGAPVNTELPPNHFRSFFEAHLKANAR